MEHQPIYGKEEIMAYGKVYMCVLGKYYHDIETEYSVDIDIFYEYFDYGMYRLPYIECMKNPKYTEIQYGRKNNNFTVNFFGHLYKCTCDLMAAMISNPPTFPEIPEETKERWDETISMITFAPID